MRKFKIGSRQIGEGGPVFIIAEAGANHDGKIAQAKKLIEAAASVGVDAVKFQLYRAEHLYLPNAGYADYLGEKAPVFEIIRKNEMPYGWLPELSDCCKDNGVLFFSAAFDEHSLDVLSGVNPPAYKIASYESNHLPLIRRTASKGKPIFISSGVSTYSEIEDALNACYAEGNRDVVLMHCVASYPTPLEQSNLSAMATVRDAFGVNVGWSDHSLEPAIAPMVSVALGACAVEKHFTLDRKLPGPDHAFALELKELAEMVGAIREIEGFEPAENAKFLKTKEAQKVLGSPVKKVADAEKELYAFAKRYIYSIAPIAAGEKLSDENIRILRSGKNPRGLEPKFWDVVLGSKAARGIAQYSPVGWDDLLTR